MEKVIDKNKCTGCTACMNICPKNAISMKEDKEGFKHPVIDQDKCINCGLCQKTCPVLNTKSNNSLNECYVGFNNNEEERLNASSGSIFSLVADYVLDSNGIVIGAAFDENNVLKHIAISNKNELEKLKKSKYVQSDLNNIFKIVKDSVEAKKVLFVGTPCQVAGLKSFLRKDYGNLICIDIICHGVPSPKLFSKYIQELENSNNDKVVNYDFRDKSTGWDTYSNNITFTKSSIKTLSKNNPYMNLFLSDVALRESCYDCNFKIGNKYSDITLGDFWGVKKYYPEMYNKNGVSCIIVNTEKGKEVIESIKNDITHKKCDINEILSGNPSLKVSSKKTKNREQFFHDIENLTINELSNKYKKKISLLKKIKSKIISIIK